MEAENAVQTAPRVEEEFLNISQAARYAGVDFKQIRDLMAKGELPGTVKGESTAEGYRIPKSEIDAAITAGKLRRKRAYHRRIARLEPAGRQSGPIPERMTIKEAAERFGIGFSTLQAKAVQGVLPSEKVQIGPKSHTRYVRAADVAALTIRRSPGRPDAREVKPIAATVPETNLTAELLRAADMVRDGKYTVVKLVVALEFNGAV